MKNSYLFILLTVLSTVFVSCSKDNDLTYAEFGFYPTTAGSKVIYADQTSDSVTIVSYKSWNVTSTVNWMTILPVYSQKTINDQYVAFTLPVNFEKNVSDTVRSGSLYAKNTDFTIAKPYIQVYWLDIIEPQVTFTNTTTYAGATFATSISSDSLFTNIRFKIFAATATLTSDVSWATPEQTNFESGEYIVKVNLVRNTTGAKRKATLTLATSNGVESKIVITQQ